MTRAKSGLCVGAIVLWLTSTLAIAGPPPVYMWRATVPVPPGLMPNDVHLLFSGTGGTIHDAVLTQDPVGGGVIAGASNQVDIVWTMNLQPGNVIVFEFSTDHPSVAFDSGIWTKNGLQIGTLGPSSVQLEPVICEGGEMPEGEPPCGDEYVDSFNGGLNSTPPVYSAIGCFDVVCGETGTFLIEGLPARDTDWYLLTLEEPTEVTWSGIAEGFAHSMTTVDPNTGLIIGDLATSVAGEAISVTNVLLPGDYALFVSTAGFTGVPCGSRYEVTVTCAPVTLPLGACCFFDGFCLDLPDLACTGAGGTWQGEDTACAPTLCPIVCGPGSGDCFVPNGSPGCDDAECCLTVCAIDDFCCNVDWDVICAEEAATLCCDFGPHPWDLDGNGAVGFADLLVLLGMWGPCPPCCPADFDGSGDVGFADLLDLLAHWGPLECEPNATGNACVGPCPDPQQCVPTKIVKSAAGALTVVDCDCLDEDACHPAITDGVVGCVGTCPPGQVCTLVSVAELDDMGDPTGGICFTCECRAPIPALPCPATPDVANWNTRPNGQYHNNCYDYSTNMKKPAVGPQHKSQPGKACGLEWQNPVCQDVKNSAICDGLIFIGNPAPPAAVPACPPGTCLVFLAVDATPNGDYHWYRLNGNGEWSHKPGWRKATNKDSSGKVIGGGGVGDPPDPRTADRRYTDAAGMPIGPPGGGYSTPCGFFCVTSATMTASPADAVGDPLPPSEVQARVLWYSGRDDPGWALTTVVEIGEVRLAVDAAIAAGAVPDPDWEGALGFSGYNLERGKLVADFPESVTVFRGQMAVMDGGVTTYYDDVLGLEETLRLRAIAEGLGSFVPPF